MQNWGQHGVWLSLVFVSALFGWTLWMEAPRLYRQGLGRAWEGNQTGYALLTAIRQTARSTQPTAYWYGGHTFATLYLKTNGVYINEYPDDSPTQLLERLRDRNVQNIIQSGEDSRLLAVINLLRERGILADTTAYRSTIWADNSWEEVSVHHLKW